jgi:methylglutaconyl-CoA hydratase
MTDLLLQYRAPGVAWIVLNRPDRHNAFDDHLIADLTAKIETVEADKTIHTIILTGNGPSFSAGADLGWMKRAAQASLEANMADAEALARLLHTLNAATKTTIALVQGAAFGGGVGLIACCDIAIGSADTKFALSEVRLGLIPAAISPFVIAAIGSRAARRYFQTAETFGSDEALRIGLLHEVVPAGELENRADALLAALDKTAPMARKDAKQLIHDVAGKPIDGELAAFTAGRIASIRAGDEAREGLAAFFAKRPANWISGGSKK